MTDERFSELRETIRLRDVPLKEALFDAVVSAWGDGMYLDAAEGLTAEENERLIAVEREMCSRPEAGKPETKP